LDGFNSNCFEGNLPKIVERKLAYPAISQGIRHTG